MVKEAVFAVPDTRKFIKNELFTDSLNDLELCSNKDSKIPFEKEPTMSAKSTWNACTVLRIFYTRPVSEALTRMYTPFAPYTMLDQ